jgi:hypothetical protein
MAARFSPGVSARTPPGIKNVQQRGKVSEPAQGLGPKGGPIRGNTMSGLPGYIKTTQDKSSSGLKGGSGSGPKREGPIGKAGGRRGNWQTSSKLGGSSDYSYRATSTGRAGAVKVMGKPKAPASRGTMESLRGRAKTSYEGGKSAKMY